MPTHVQQVKQVGSNGAITTRTTRVDDDVSTTSHGVTSDTRSASLAARIVWYVAGVLLTLLAFRFILAMLGANPSNPFANFIYTLSYPFVAPFFNLFGYNLHYGVSHIETFTLVAMLVYAIVAGGIARLLTLKRDAEADEQIQRW